ncbi:MAG: hypothetical protein WCV62_01955 [Candidatus Peribacteraceae bacterium]
MHSRSVLLLWFASDIALFILSYALAYFWRVGWILSTDFPFTQYIAVATLVAPVWLVVLISTRIFHLTRSQWTRSSFLSMLYANIVGSALFALTYYFLYGLFFSRLLLIEALFLSTVILRLWHLAFQQISRSMLWRAPAFPTLIVGVTRESRQLITLLSRRKNPLRPVAVLDGRGAKEKDIAGVPVLGKLDKLEETLREKRITHLIQCSDLEQSLNLLSACRQHGITYLLLPSVLGVIEKDERVTSLEGWAATMVRPDIPWWKGLFLP